MISLAQSFLCFGRIAPDKVKTQQTTHVHC